MFYVLEPRKAMREGKWPYVGSLVKCGPGDPRDRPAVVADCKLRGRPRVAASIPTLKTSAD